MQYTSFETPVGRLGVAYRDQTVCYADLNLEDVDFEASCSRWVGSTPRRAEPPGWLAHAVQDFFEGATGRFSADVDLSQLSELQQRALRKVMEVGRGEVRTYSQIAREIGAPQAARAVGTAMARNPVGVLVPCHRAIRNDFIPRTYGCGGPAKKAEILAWEGVDLPSLQRQARLSDRKL